MSTPRTDAKQRELDGYYDLNAHDRYECMTEFAQQLETDLAAATERAEKAEAELKDSVKLHASALVIATRLRADLKAAQTKEGGK